MSGPARVPSPRRDELLERAYGYTLTHGLADLSLRPLAAAIGSSPRVLLFLFGSKDALVRALLARARLDELAMLDGVRAGRPNLALDEAAALVWQWLSDPAHRDLLRLWVEAYTRSLVDPSGPWDHFAARTVADWLSLFAQFQPRNVRRSAAGAGQRTAALAVLRGALLDLLATGDQGRTTAAVHRHLKTLSPTTELPAENRSRRPSG